MKRIAIAVAVLLAAGAARAQAGGPDPAPEGKWWKNPRVVREIGLTEPQTTKLEAIFRRTKPALIDLRADLEKKQFALQTLMDGPSVDPQEASRRIDEVEKARAKLAKSRAMMFVEFRQILTPQQFEKLQGLRLQMRERRRERMREPGRGPRRGSGPSPESPGPPDPSDFH
jgi:Spy/CpxP family protein refolding chaperone